MILQTLDNRYAVLQVLRSSETEQVCVCQDLDEERDERYTLARFRDRELSRKLLPMLILQRDNSAFEDFLGLFSQDGDLCVRFRYTQAPLLKEQLERQSFRYRERIEIASALLERMTLLNMPPAIQFEALRDQNITVDAALRVRFNYILEPMNACSNVDMGFISNRVEQIMRNLFAQELSVKGVPELEEYLTWLSQGDCASYIELYQGFDRIRTRLLERAEGNQVVPRTWLFRMWDKIKALRPYVWPVLSGLVLIAAFCYLVYTLLLPPIPKGTPVPFDMIGTVEIQPNRGYGPGTKETGN